MVAAAVIAVAVVVAVAVVASRSPIRTLGPHTNRSTKVHRRRAPLTAEAVVVRMVRMVAVAVATLVGTGRATASHARVTPTADTQRLRTGSSSHSKRAGSNPHTARRRQRLQGT